MDDSIVDHVTRVLVQAHDPEYGSFGKQPKNSPVSANELLLHIYQSTGDHWYLQAVELALDNMMAGGLHDGEEGGFFRYSAERDWSLPGREKPLEDNVGLLGLYLGAHLVTGRDDYARVASEIAGYLNGRLRDGATGAFYAGRDADELNTDLNSALVSAYLEAAWVLNEPALGDVALETLDYILAQCRDRPLRHSYSTNEGASEATLLPDYAWLVIALLDAYAHTSRRHYLAEAERLADAMVGSQAIGNPAVGEVPLADNAIAAEALMRLHNLAPAGDYRRRAEDALNAFVDVYQDYGEAAAGYALVVQRFLYQAIEVTVVGQAGTGESMAMLKAAATVPYQHIVIRFVGADDKARLSELGYFAGDETQAYVCLETLCLAPVNDPVDLHRTVTEFLQSRSRGVDSIFQLLGDSGLTLPN